MTGTDGATPRQRARAESLQRIKRLALEQLADGGAAELSLRAIARELHVVSSALYRYFPSRDALLTALIIDAYDDLADVLEQAGSRARTPRSRWLATCAALRDWAIAEPHRFTLIYGSSIPGYRAPSDTIPPAGRVVRALLSPAAAASLHGRPGRALGRQLSTSADTLGLGVTPPTMLALVGAFSALIGALTLELGGHFVGGFEPADDLYAALIEREADALGL